MYFGIVEESSENVPSDLSYIINKISEHLKNGLSKETFGNSIERYLIGIICVSPEFDFFSKVQKNYKRNKKILEYDIKLEYNKVIDADKEGIKNILKENIIESVKIIDELKVENFESEKFNQYLINYFNSDEFNNI